MGKIYVTYSIRIPAERYQYDMKMECTYWIRWWAHRDITAETMIMVFTGRVGEKQYSRKTAYGKHWQRSSGEFENNKGR